MIIIDIHEAAILQQAVQSEAARQNPPIPTSIEGMPIADFVFPLKSTAIEHKRFPDFVGSLISGRLKEQAYNMLSVYNNCFIIISGNREELESGVHSHSIAGGIVSMTAKYKIPILWAKDDEEIAYMVCNLYNKIDQPLKPFGDVAKRLDYSEEQIKVAMVATIPGFGQKRAKKILEACDWDLRKIANLTVEDVFLVDGMTDGMALNLMKIFSRNKKE